MTLKTGYVVMICLIALYVGLMIGIITDSPSSSGYPPQDIKVGPYHYLLRFEESRLLQESDPGVKGYTTPLYRLIAIDNSLTIEDKKETVIHELLHACRDIGGIHNNQSDPDSEVFEAVIPTFMQVMKDNPELERWLFH